MEQTIKSISPNELLGEVTALKKEGYRLVAISCTNKDGMELSYSFDKEYDFLNLRLNISSDAEVESISLIYPFAFLYENEIKELFGVNIKNISLDFDGHLYITAIPTPFKTENCSLEGNQDGR
jgi:ech hydrogenase subunit D